MLREAQQGLIVLFLVSLGLGAIYLYELIPKGFSCKADKTFSFQGSFISKDRAIKVRLLDKDLQFNCDDNPIMTCKNTNPKDLADLSLKLDRFDFTITFESANNPEKEFMARCVMNSDLKI